MLTRGFTCTLHTTCIQMGTVDVNWGEYLYISKKGFRKTYIDWDNTLYLGPSVFWSDVKGRNFSLVEGMCGFWQRRATRLTITVISRKDDKSVGPPDNTLCTIRVWNTVVRYVFFWLTGPTRLVPSPIQGGIWGTDSLFQCVSWERTFRGSPGVWVVQGMSWGTEGKVWTEKEVKRSSHDPRRCGPGVGDEVEMGRGTRSAGWTK